MTERAELAAWLRLQANNHDVSIANNDPVVKAFSTKLKSWADMVAAAPPATALPGREELRAAIIDGWYEGNLTYEECDKTTRLRCDFATNAALSILSARVAWVETDAARYRFLRERDLDTITKGGVFAGMTPINIILNGDDLDAAIDAYLTTPSGMTMDEIGEDLAEVRAEDRVS